MRTIWILAVAVLVTGAWAGPLPRAELPARARWVVHLDAEQFRNSKAGAYFIENMFEERLSQAQASTGFDFGPFFDSLQSVTLYGLDFKRDEENSAVVLLRGAKAETQHVEEFLIEHSGTGRKAPVQKLRSDPFMLFKVDKGFAATLTNGTVVLGRTRKLVEDACEVLAGRQANAATSERFATLADATKPFILGLAGDGATEEVPWPRNLKVLRQVAGAQLVVRESAAHLEVELALKTESAEAAAQIKTAADGFLALAESRQPANKNLQALIKSAKISAAGETVTATFEFSNKRAIALMRRGAARAEVK